MQLRNTTKSAITLFEVLTAIIIFGLGILTILQLIINNITWVRQIGQNNTATMLAKEAMEIIYNFRDSNLEKGLVWYCSDFDVAEDDNCGGEFYDGGVSVFSGQGTDYIVERTTTGAYTLTPMSSTGESLLYLHTGSVAATGAVTQGFWYNHVASGGTATPYYRYVTFKPSPLYTSNTGNILQVEVTTLIVQGSRTREVVLESLIGDIR